MFNNKATSYQQMEKTPRQRLASFATPKEKKFKQNEYEEIRKLVEENEGNETVKEIKNKKKNNSKENPYNFKLFD